MYGGRTRFHTAPWIRVALSIIAAGSLAAAVYFYSEEGLSWLTAFFAGFSVFCGAGIIESFTAYIALEDTEVRFRQTLRSTAIPRSAIRRVTWEGGSGVSLLLDDGTWVKLPDLGQNSQGLTNSIRAWLKDA